MAVQVSNSYPVVSVMTSATSIAFPMALMAYVLASTMLAELSMSSVILVNFPVVSVVRVVITPNLV